MSDFYDTVEHPHLGTICFLWAQDEESLRARARDFLLVAEPRPFWVRPAAVYRRLGINCSTFLKRLESPSAPIVQRRLGPSGRTLFILLTPALSYHLGLTPDQHRSLQSSHT